MIFERHNNFERLILIGMPCSVMVRCLQIIFIFSYVLLCCNIKVQRIFSNCSRSPHGERGLKCAWAGGRERDHDVAPHTGSVD